jgi:hypothetical protein
MLSVLNNKTKNDVTRERNTKFAAPKKSLTFYTRNGISQMPQGNITLGHSITQGHILIITLRHI